MNDTRARHAGLDGPRLHDLLGFHLRRVSTESMNTLSGKLMPFSLRVVHYSALSVIVDEPGILPTRLARQLRTKPANLAPIITDLLRMDLISRTTSTSDRRAAHLVPSTKGNTLLPLIHELVLDHEAKFSDRLNAEERTLLIQLLLKLSGPVDEDLLSER